MKKINSENVLNLKNIENGENTPKEDQKANKKEDAKEESNIILTPSHTSEEPEYNFDLYPQDDLNSNLYNDFENFCNDKREVCDGEGKEEPKTCENIKTKEEIKTTESTVSTENDSQMDLKTNSFQELFLKENKSPKKKKKINTNIITISLYIQRIQKIIQIKPDIFFQQKKKMTKENFYSILKVNNLDGYIEKIEFSLKEENSEDKDKTNNEIENVLNNDSSDTSIRQDFDYLDISEAIMQDMAHENYYENSNLFESLTHFDDCFNNFHSTINNKNCRKL